MAAGFSGRAPSRWAEMGRAPSGFFVLHPPGANNKRYPWNFLRGYYGTGDMCKEMYHDLSIGVQTCGKVYNTHRTRTTGPYGAVEKTAVLDCGTGAGAVTGGFAIMTICTKTCMEQAKYNPAAPKCCFVPKIYANMFSCCREYSCCPDQGYVPRPTNTTASPTSSLTLDTTAPTQHGGSGTWTKAPNKYCAKSGSRGAGGWTATAFPSASAAEAACASSSSCSAVYDQKCDGAGSFYMCRAGSVKASSQGSCVYQGGGDSSGDGGSSDDGGGNDQAPTACSCDGCLYYGRCRGANSHGATQQKCNGAGGKWCSATAATGRRLRQRQSQTGAGLSITVQVSVDVERNNAATTVFDKLLRCLQNPKNTNCAGTGGH